MENRNNILNELGNISPAIVNIGNENVFSVPNGYFDTLPNNIIDRIGVSETVNKANSNLFIIPADYFTDLAGNILLKVSQQANELEEIAPVLRTLNRQNLASIPNGYFEDFATNMLVKIKECNDIELELETIAPVLNTISKENLYTVPAHYFETFSVQNKTPLTAKIVKLGNTRKWFTYIAAAAMAGVLVTGGIKFMAGNQIVDGGKLKVQEELGKLNDDDIQQYLNKQTTVDYVVNNNTANDDINPQDLLEETSSEEIQNYLKENPVTEEVAKKDI
jgi:hypothetical protein